LQGIAVKAKAKFMPEAKLNCLRQALYSFTLGLMLLLCASISKRHKQKLILGKAKALPQKNDYSTKPDLKS
jgi:hypothetical protein